MGVYSEIIEFFAEAEKGIVDITKDVQKIVEKSGFRNGIATVFIVGSTGAVTTMEYEPGLKKDIPRALERIAPSNIDYEHHKTWHDDNGKSHVRASIVGSSITVPFINGRLTLGTWQQIVAMNLDTRDRHRKVVVVVIGD